MTTPTQYPPIIKTREDLKAACALIVAMGMPDPRTVRFWYLHRTHWVRITLKPGQTLRHSFTYWNGEGNTCEAVMFHYDAETRRVVMDYYETGRDCDGRSSYRWVGTCPTDDLASVPVFVEHARSTHHLHAGSHIRRPEWGTAKRAEWDEFAELSGY